MAPRPIPNEIIPLLPNSGGLIIKTILFKLRNPGSAKNIFIGDRNNQPLTLHNIGDATAIDATGECKFLDGNSYFGKSDATDENDLPLLEIIMLTE
jgi:hypothetical protein